MKSSKKKVMSRLLLSGFTAAALMAAPLVSHGDEIVVVDTVIAPGVLIEDNLFVSSLTFHASTPFENVITDDFDTYPMEVCTDENNCAQVDAAFDDTRDDLVARISVEKVKALGLDSDADNTLTLKGYFLDTSQFSGSDEIYVKTADTAPKHQPKPQTNKP